MKMIPIVITPIMLYSLMRGPKFDVMCSYLLNQSVIKLYAPSQVYSELEKIYAYIGIRWRRRKSPKPKDKHLQLMEKLKEIITLVPVADNNEKYKKYRDMASYVELCDRIQAFGIWNKRLFHAKFDVTTNHSYTITDGIPYLPTSEILRFLGKERDYLATRWLTR